MNAVCQIFHCTVAIEWWFTAGTDVWVLFRHSHTDRRHTRQTAVIWNTGVIKVKVSFYIAKYPVTSFTLHPLTDQFLQLNFSGKYSAMPQLLHKDYSFTYPLYWCLVPLTWATNVLNSQVPKQTHIKVTHHLLLPADSNGVALQISSPTYFNHIKWSRHIHHYPYPGTHLYSSVN